jgi:HEPN domain-containing protein
MVDIKKQISYWRDNALEDLNVARDLVRDAKVRHGLFFAHLAIEKALKAIVCNTTGDIAPRIHNLVRLAELAGIDLAAVQRDLLAEFNAFNLEGRYPNPLAPPVSQQEAMEYFSKAEEILAWLISRL